SPHHRPPTPTLFPYTTLFRSRVHGDGVDRLGDRRLVGGGWVGLVLDVLIDEADGLADERRTSGEQLIEHTTGGVEVAADVDRVRSEEHTSELQSRFDLVCRLL